MKRTFDSHIKNNGTKNILSGSQDGYRKLKVEKWQIDPRKSGSKFDLFYVQQVASCENPI